MGKLTDRVILERRVKRLEDEIQECRATSLRLAELLDVMTELVLPAAQRDERQLAEALQRYQQSL